MGVRFGYGTQIDCILDLYILRVGRCGMGRN